MANDLVRVLLVDDDADDYQLTRDLLAETPGKRINLDWAKDYEAGIEAIGSCGHDAYLIDYRLGRRDGLELIREAINLGCKGPMILLTGAGDRELALDALDAGAADFLVKGEIDATNLERSIRYSIQQARHSEDLEEKVRSRTTELEQTNAALIAQQEILEAVAIGKSLDEILELTTRMIERQIPGTLASILLSSPDGSRLVGGSAKSLPEEYTAALVNLPIDEFSGSCGTAAFRRETVVVEDIATNGLWKDYKDLAIKFDLRACWSIPIESAAGDLYGTVAIYFGQPTARDERYLQVLDAAARLAAIAIGRWRAEDELRRSEERRHLAQEAGNVGVFDWDIIADKTYWSETMWKFYGEELVDVNPDEEFWSEHIHPNDRERVKENMHAAMAGGSDRFSDEYRIVRSDGTIRWIEAAAEISRDAEGRATRMYGVNLDITRRKEIEERIRLNEYQLRMVTDTVPALISYVDSAERYRFVNKKYTDWFGKPKEKILGRSVAEIVGAQAYRRIKPKIDEALAGSECVFEMPLTFKGAGNRFVSVSYSPDIGVDGYVRGFYALTSDLTDLKQSRDLLRSSEDRIGLIMESLADYAIFSMDSEGRIESWNLGAEKIFGYTHAEILGRSCELLYSPEDVARGVPLREMRTARQKGRALDQRWHIRKDGARFFANGVLMPLYVGDALTGYAKVASDLTETQRRAEELQQAHDQLELRVAERTKELAETNLALRREMEERELAETQRIDLLRRLVSSQESERRRIARDLHDTLGQRLTALRLKIASLKQLANGNKIFVSRVQRLQEISERLDTEVSFLAWELRPSALDDLGLADAVGAYVSEWSKHYEIPADFHTSRVTREFASRDAETHLYRITQEALNNIAKHAAANRVSVLLERRDDDLILIVEDDGKGFQPALQPVPAESGKGLGLLGMSERAVLIGGEIEIESAPGRGTTIYARVPFTTNS